MRRLIAIFIYIPALLALSASPCTSHSAAAQDKVRVLAGEELLVSMASGASGISQKLPTIFSESGGVAVASALGDGVLSVVSISSASPRGPARVVEADVEDLKKRCRSLLQRNPKVLTDCEPNAVRRLYAEPNDEYYTRQVNLRQIGAPAAWDISTSAKGTLVAVVDTGINYRSRELSDSIAVNTGEKPFNLKDDDGNGLVDDYLGYDFGDKDNDPDDEDGHGSHVSGIIGAVSNNDIGIAGVAWNASLLPVKVFDKSGYATAGKVAAGIRYAVNRGAKVINLSLGGDRPSAHESRAIWFALQNDVLVVAAAGNDSRNLDQLPAFPPSYALDNIISVAALTRGESLATLYSNFGANSVDVAAPGSDILSVFLENYLAYMSGTSMAAPHVAGIAAVMRSTNPSLSFAETKTIIMNTVDIRSTLLGKTVTGGKVDFGRALKAAKDNLRNPLPPVRVISIASQRTQAGAKVFGTMLSRNRVPLADQWTALVCNGRAFRRAKTQAEGYYEYNIEVPAVSPYSCFVEDDRGSRSGAVALQ